MDSNCTDMFQLSYESAKFDVPVIKVNSGCINYTNQISDYSTQIKQEQLVRQEIFLVCLELFPRQVDENLLQAHGRNRVKVNADRSLPVLEQPKRLG